MLSGHQDIFYAWVKTIEKSEYTVTESSILYNSYAEFFNANKKVAFAQPLPNYEWGVYMTALFGPSGRKRLNGKVCRVRSLVLKQ